MKYPIHDLRGISLQLFLAFLRQIRNFLLDHDLLNLHFPQLKDMNMKRVLADIFEIIDKYSCRWSYNQVYTCICFC